MVKLEEVEDEELNAAQPVPADDDDDDYVDTDSSLSDTDSEPDVSESLTERLAALKDILPPSTRRRLTSSLSTTFDTSKTVGLFTGRILWALVTTSLLVGIPFTIAALEEQQILEQEKEMKAQEEMREGFTPGLSGAQSGLEKGVGPTL